MRNIISADRGKLKIDSRERSYTSARTRVARSASLVSATNYELAGTLFRPAAGLLLMSAPVKIGEKKRERTAMPGI